MELGKGSGAPAPTLRSPPRSHRPLPLRLCSGGAPLQGRALLCLLPSSCEVPMPPAGLWAGASAGTEQGVLAWQADGMPVGVGAGRRKFVQAELASSQASCFHSSGYQQIHLCNGSRPHAVHSSSVSRWVGSLDGDSGHLGLSMALPLTCWVTLDIFPLCAPLPSICLAIRLSRAEWVSRSVCSPRF